MTIGQGSVIRNSPGAPAGAPFPANSADNGCSVDPTSGRIVLGNDSGATLAQLLSTRNIPMDTFLIEFTKLLWGLSLGNCTDFNQGGAINFTDQQAAGIPYGQEFNDANTSQDYGKVAQSAVTPAQQETFGMFLGQRNSSNGTVFGIMSRRNNCFVGVVEGGVIPAATAAQLQVDGSINTADPGAGIGLWRLGQVQAGAVALDNANYVEVMIDGAVVRLAIVV